MMLMYASLQFGCHAQTESTPDVSTCREFCIPDICVGQIILLGIQLGCSHGDL
jgi:hypothetical protein